VTTYQQQTSRRGGLRGWSRTRWFVILGLVAAAVVVAVLLLVYAGGGSGGGVGGGY